MNIVVNIPDCCVMHLVTKITNLRPAQPLWLFPHIAGEGGTNKCHHAITRVSSKQREALN